VATPAKKPTKKPVKAASTPAVRAVKKNGAQRPVKAVAKAPDKAGKATKPSPKPALAAAPAPKLAEAVQAVEPKKAPTAKPRKGPLTPKELEAARIGLVQYRATLTQEADDLNAGTFDTSQSELSGEVAFDEEYADAGTFTFERERDLSLGNNIRDLIDKIDTALIKIERGTYGICERCGEPIPKERLQALPYSVLCLRCKQIEERQR
jgi:DnaK suppressor protein